MATNFPTSIDNFTNPTTTSLLTSPSHAGQHSDINDAVEAIETAIGTTAAPVLAGLASPTFTGTPAAPTASVGTNTTQIATTAFVLNNGPVMPMVSTYYYKTIATNSSIASIANRTFYLPFFIAQSTTIDRIALRTGATFSGTATVRLGIYNSSGGQPTTVSLDAGTVSATASTTNYTITVSHTLAAGLYFLAQNTQTAASTNNYVSANLTSYQMPTGTSPGSIVPGWQEDVNVTTGFGTVATLTTTGGNAPDVWIRKA
tara:strand:+ start:1604 stop:2380 length:777 start_codon:yes stop_codon:yes gene_type:complete